MSKKLIKAIAFMMVLVLPILMSGFQADAKTVKYDLSQITAIEGWTQITDEIFVSTGQYVKVTMTLVVSGNEATLIDTGYNIEEALRTQEYMDQNNITLKNLIITHRHADHAANAGMFLTEGVNLYYPLNTEDGEIITMGDKVFKVIYTPGHAGDEHMSVELVNERILVAGDVVVNCLAPALPFGLLGKISNSQTLIATLENIKKQKYELIIPGHGDIVNTKESLDRSLDYLYNSRKLITKLIKSGGTAEDLMTIQLEDVLKNIDHLLEEEGLNRYVHSLNMQIIYQELQK
jgi:glyoxylase-like metal-dependent hydrolase (beta-lactamase superfamily II)